ncbi:MAG: hypothetical protein ACLR5S_06535 [Ruminococcus sp.]
MGDCDQLPSVGRQPAPGSDHSGRVPVVALKEIFRQAQKQHHHQCPQDHRGEYPISPRNSDCFFPAAEKGATS